MTDRTWHISDADLLLYADGELAEHDKEQVWNHLAICAACRNRHHELQRSLKDLKAAHLAEFAGRLPSHTEASRRLNVALRPRSHGFASSWSFLLQRGWAGKLSYTLAALLFAAAAVSLISYGSNRKAIEPETPLSKITPGDAILISRSAVCGSRPPAIAVAIPSSLRAAVLREYRVGHSSPPDYELDYLITPQLGGTASLRNLWPEPYSAKWNAHVKDQLEDRLHDLVCSGQLDLATAQHELASNWVAAYRKHFHTSEPLPGR